MHPVRRKGICCRKMLRNGITSSSECHPSSFPGEYEHDIQRTYKLKSFNDQEVEHDL